MGNTLRLGKEKNNRKNINNSIKCITIYFPADNSIFKCVYVTSFY